MLKNFGRKPYKQISSWIAPKGVSNRQAVTFRARQIAERSQLDTDGLFYISSESYYAFFVNGHHIRTGPVRGTMSCNFVDEVDASVFLKNGENQIAVEVYCDNIPNFRTSPAEPAVFITSGQLITDSTWQVQVAEEYRTEDVPKYTEQIGVMEWRDMQQYPFGWPIFEDHGVWTNACVISSDRPIHQKHLYHRDLIPLRCQTVHYAKICSVKKLDSIPSNHGTDIASLMTHEVHHPVTLDLSDPITAEPPGTRKGMAFIVDMGQEFVGHLDIELDAPAGTILDVGYQESIENGRLNLAPSDGYRFADRYITAEGRQKIESPLRWRGGRYIQLAIREFHRPVILHDIAVKDHRYAVDESSNCNFDDAFYEKLWVRSQDTLSACATDTIMDCPWREQAFWVNDFVLVNRYWLQMFGKSDLARRCIALAISQRDSDTNLIPGVCPYDGRSDLCFFATNLFLPLILHEYVMYTGDVVFAGKVIGEITSIVQQCETYTDETGLIRPPKNIWNFVDWSFELTGISLRGRNSCVVNWFHVLSLVRLSQLYALLEYHKSASELNTQADVVARRIDRYFWDSSVNCYREWYPAADEEQSPLAGRLAHALALLSGHFAADKSKFLQNNLVRDELPFPELYMMNFLFESLIHHGLMTTVQHLIRQFWGPIIASNCPTIWEANVHQHGKAAYDHCGSLCHAFSLGPASVMQQYMLGIKPIAPGFSQVSIAPQPGELKHIAGNVLTPHGQIKLVCQQLKQTVELELDLPSGVTAVLPDHTKLTGGKHRKILPQIHF